MYRFNALYLITASQPCGAVTVQFTRHSALRAKELLPVNLRLLRSIYISNSAYSYECISLRRTIFETSFLNFDICITLRILFKLSLIVINKLNESKFLRDS